MPGSVRRGDDDDSQSVNASALFDVPAALADFNAKLGTEGSLSCDAGGGVIVDTRSGGYTTNGNGADGTHYCADNKENPTYIWWQSNMDIDCDGSDGSGDVCSGDGSYQSDTAFQDASGNNIDAKTVQYVVIDQDDNFDPTTFGVQPLSTVAVVCGGKLTFGVWADTNAIGSMGEASVYLGRVCFGTSIDGDNGYDDPDVLYIAFPGDKADTVPSGDGSDEQALFDMGLVLVNQTFGTNGSVSTGNASGAGSSETPQSATADPSPSSRPADNVVSAPQTNAATIPATSVPVTTSASPSSATSSSSSGENLDFISSSSTGSIFLVLAGVSLLLAAGFVWLCVRQRAPPRALAHSRRGSQTQDSSDETDGSSSSDDSDGDSSTEEGTASEDDEDKRLYRRDEREHGHRR